MDPSKFDPITLEFIKLAQAKWMNLYFARDKAVSREVASNGTVNAAALLNTKYWSERATDPILVKGPFWKEVPDDYIEQMEQDSDLVDFYLFPGNAELRECLAIKLAGQKNLFEIDQFIMTLHSRIANSALYSNGRFLLSVYKQFSLEKVHLFGEQFYLKIIAAE